MSEGKRKRTEDHYNVAQYKSANQQQQQQSHNPILQQQIIVNPILTHAEQINQNEQIHLLNTNLTNNNNNQNAQSNLVYIILPQGVNQTQNLLQGVQTVLLVPNKDEQGNLTNDGLSQVQYCLPYSEIANVESQVKKVNDEVVFVKDVKVLKQEPGISVEYLPQTTTPQTDPLQIQAHDSNNVLSQYGEPQLENIFVFNDKELQKIQVGQVEPLDPKPKMHVKCNYPGCILSFPSIYEKKIHADTHIFQASSEFKCNICNMSFNLSSERNKHVDTHAIVSTYKCKNCEKTFPYYTSLVKHVNEEKCASDKSHSCHYCGVQFVDVSDLEKHQKDNVKRCVCHAKICSEQAFELHTTLCTLYKQKLGNIRKPRVKSKPRNSNEVIVLD